MPKSNRFIPDPDDELFCGTNGEENVNPNRRMTDAVRRIYDPNMVINIMPDNQKFALAEGNLRNIVGSTDMYEGNAGYILQAMRK